MPQKSCNKRHHHEPKHNCAASLISTEEDPILQIAANVRKHITTTIEPLKNQLESLLRTSLTNQEKADLIRLKDKTQEIITIGKSLFNLASSEDEVIHKQ